MPPKRRPAPTPRKPDHFEQTLIGLDVRQLLEIGRDFEQVRFLNCPLAEANLGNLRFEDCLFERCDLGNARLGGAALQNVAFTDCRLLGVGFGACQDMLFAVHFDQCLMRYATFGGKRLVGTRFTGCQLQDADFTNADLSQAVFQSCDLTGTVFHATRLVGADFTTATNFSLDPEANELTGARFALAGLPGLLDKYGLVVE